MVAFSGASGRAWAQWCGSEMPRVGALVDVEVEVRDEIVQWAVVDGPAAMVSDTPVSPVRIRGVVDAAAEESMAAVRVGSDIVLVEFARPANPVPGQVDKPRVGTLIEFMAPQTEIHPYFV